MRPGVGGRERVAGFFASEKGRTAAVWLGESRDEEVLSDLFLSAVWGGSFSVVLGENRLKVLWFFCFFSKARGGSKEDEMA